MSFICGFNLVNFPKFSVFLKHITDDEFLVSVDHENHAFRLGSLGENKGDVARRGWSKLDGVDMLAIVASNHEISTGSNRLLAENFVPCEFITRWAMGGVVEDFFLFLPFIDVFHRAPSFLR